MKTVNWGIIGCGSVCEVKSGPPLYKTTHSRLVAVMRRNGDKAKDFARRHQADRWYSDARKLVDDPEVNAVYIATPPDTHAKYAAMAAKAGKAVYVEKPMARTAKEAEQIRDVCEKAGVPLFVAYYRRALPYFLKVRELIREDHLGTLTHLQLHLFKSPKPDDLKPVDERTGWRTNPEISGGGYFHDLGSHQLDLLEFLLGLIITIDGHGINRMDWYEPNDMVHAEFRFESGLTGCGSWNFTVSEEKERDEIILFGTKGKLTFSTFDDSVPIVLETTEDQQEYLIPYPEHVQAPLMEQIVAELRGEEGVKCSSTGDTGLRANQLMDQILS